MVQAKELMPWATYKDGNLWVKLGIPDSWTDDEADLFYIGGVSSVKEVQCQGKSQPVDYVEAGGNRIYKAEFSMRSYPGERIDVKFAGHTFKDVKVTDYSVASDSGSDSGSDASSDSGDSSPPPPQPQPQSQPQSQPAPPPSSPSDSSSEGEDGGTDDSGEGSDESLWLGMKSFFHKVKGWLQWGCVGLVTILVIDVIFFPGHLLNVIEFVTHWQFSLENGWWNVARFTIIALIFLFAFFSVFLQEKRHIRDYIILCFLAVLSFNMLGYGHDPFGDNQKRIKKLEKKVERLEEVSDRQKKAIKDLRENKEDKKKSSLEHLYEDSGK